MSSTTELKTARLLLKHLGDQDKYRLVELLSVYEVAQSLTRVPYPYTLSDAEDWLARVKENPFNLSIFLNDELIGGVSLSDRRDRSYELGYWVGADYWGQGFATEAAGGLLNFAYLQIHPLVVVANVYKENVVSSKVLRKLGFTATGEGEVFSLPRQVWVPTFTYRYEA
ncbi:MAG: GCN5 family acetyltransferase [Gammaproteobacteria bacterium]|nr:GCN5 family acetyltransferase [Gammaproteobacteria bacterium]